MRFPDFRLTDKIAIVTGASKGLGQGTALALAECWRPRRRHQPRPGAGRAGRRRDP